MLNELVSILSLTLKQLYTVVPLPYSFFVLFFVANETKKKKQLTITVPKNVMLLL